MELASRCRIVERMVWQTSSLIRLSMLTVKPMFIWIKVLVNWVLFAASYSAHLGQRGSVQELWLICGIVFFLHVSCRNGRRRRPSACGCCIQIRVAGQKLGKLPFREWPQSSNSDGIVLPSIALRFGSQVKYQISIPGTRTAEVPVCCSMNYVYLLGKLFSVTERI
jgi:hypothetical protein